MGGDFQALQTNDSNPSRTVVEGLWDKQSVRWLLLKSHVVVSQDPWRTWIMRRGGLTRIQDQLLQLALDPDERKLLTTLITEPKQSPPYYAEAINVELSSYHRRVRGLIATLVLYLNTGALDTVHPAVATAQVKERLVGVPDPPFPIVGRNDEAEALCSLLLNPDVRLVTLTGMGGIGKTRLAIHVARQLYSAFHDGALFVPLATVREHTAVLPAIARVLNIQETGNQGLFEHLKVYLADKHLLLVLDNFEHILLSASAVSDLMGFCPNLHVLTTSREPLRIYGEHEFAVPLLLLPDKTSDLTPKNLMTYSSIALFVERARSFSKKFHLTDDNSPAVVEICARLDGLPLAIELITAWAKVLGPESMLSRLRKGRLDLLSRGALDLPLRQQTLREAISWSYNLLSAGEKRLFYRISVFIGGCTIDAAVSVCDKDNDILIDMLTALTSLVDKNLIHQNNDGYVEPQFTMLESLREYAMEQLVIAGEEELLMTRHAHYYLGLLDQTRDLFGEEEIAWLNHLEREHDNIRQALRWFINSGDAESALKMCSSLWDFWYTRGHFREGRQWLAEAFKGREGVSDSTIAKACYADGILAVALGLYDNAIHSFEEARLIWSEQANKQGLARIYHSVGLIHMRRNEQDTAMSLFEQAHKLSYETHNLRGVVSALQNMGSIALQRGDYKRAHAEFQEALETAKREDFTRGIVMAIAALGSTAYWQKEYIQCISYYKESLRINQQLNDQDALVVCIESLGLAAYELGEFRTAAILFGAGAKHREKMGWAVVESQVRRVQKQKILSAEERFGKTWTLWWIEGESYQIGDVVQYIYNNL